MSIRLARWIPVVTLISLGGLLVSGLAGCGSSPSAPTPPQTPPPPPSTPGAYTLSGRVVGTVTGVPIAGARVAVGEHTFTTDATGLFTITGDAPNVREIVVSGPGLITRTTRLSLDSRSVTIDVIQDRSPFDLDFFQTIARNALETEGGLEPLRPLRSAPRIHIRTVDERGRRVDPELLDLVEDALRDAAPIWSAGRLPLEVVERGSASRQGQAGWVTVLWPNPADLSLCGRATLGSSTGYIELHHRNPDCWCGTPELFSPMVVRHELGHIYGYWHTGSVADVMDGGEWPEESCDLRSSAREVEHAKYMYSRPEGNTNPDNDPEATVLRTPRVIVVDN